MDKIKEMIKSVQRFFKSTFGNTKKTEVIIKTNEKDKDITVFIRGRKR